MREEEARDKQKQLFTPIDTNLCADQTHRIANHTELLKSKIPASHVAAHYMPLTHVPVY